MDYECERGARRNFEVWREAKLNEETEEEMLDRIEKEENERDAMKELERKTVDAKMEMAVADALDESGTGEKVRRLEENLLLTGPEDRVKEDVAVPAPTFTRQIKKKKDFSAALGIKKKSLV
ncbi:Pre-mRNA-splicing factor cwf16 [Oleoguttula sp. CCFEE 5521]